MTAGYAAFQTNLSISAKGNIKDYNAAWQLKKKVTSSGDGLYIDLYEDNRYIYRGTNPNNYIKFNNELWRIISIESGDTLKIMKNESVKKSAFDSQKLRDKLSSGAGGTYCANSNYGCNAWGINSNFINGGVSGSVLKDAEINIYLNNTYYSSLSQNSKNLIQSNIWSVGAVALNNNDLPAQILSENSIKWNGNIGLISVSDALKANSNTNQCNTLKLTYDNRNICKTTNYMVPETGRLWTISPISASSDMSYNAGGVHRLTYEGNIGNDYAISTEVDIHPVTYIKSNIKLSGQGTSTNPYTINLKEQ